MKFELCVFLICISNLMNSIDLKCLVLVKAGSEKFLTLEAVVFHAVFYYAPVKLIFGKHIIFADF